jgi:hypothetical protein
VTSGELFKSFQPKWWDEVSVRAWSRTLLGLQVDVQPALFTLAVLALSTIITAIGIGVSKAVLDLQSSLLAGLGWCAVFYLFLIRNMWKCANEIHEEHLTTIANLEATLSNSTTRDRTVQLTGVSAQGQIGNLSVVVDPEVLNLQGHAPTAVITPTPQEELIKLRVDGVKIRNERLAATTPAEYQAWLARVETWESRVDEALKRAHDLKLITLADVARFGTLDKGIPMQRWAHAINPDHNNQLRYLSRRIDILLEIMAKM